MSSYDGHSFISMFTFEEKTESIAVYYSVVLCAFGGEDFYCLGDSDCSVSSILRLLFGYY